MEESQDWDLLRTKEEVAENKSFWRSCFLCFFCPIDATQSRGHLDLLDGNLLFKKTSPDWQAHNAQVFKYWEPAIRRREKEPKNKIIQIDVTSLFYILP